MEEQQLLAEQQAAVLAALKTQEEEAARLEELAQALSHQQATQLHAHQTALAKIQV